MRYIFAGDREISVKILKFILFKGFKPSGLFVSSEKQETHAKELIELSELNNKNVFHGANINNKNAIECIKNLEVDYIIGVHFPYIISSELLKTPKVGVLNLHPAYLPYNKGWHTPSWAIIDQNYYGATLHFMSEKLDGGDIINQEKIKVSPGDTANTLYAKVLLKEIEVFKKSFNDILSLNPTRIKQKARGTSHSKKNLESIQEIDLSKKYLAQDLINLLRGLTTNKIEEAAYYSVGGIKYQIQVKITPTKTGLDEK